MLASVGQDTLSDIPRFTFNNMNLSDGISFVLVVMATFAMSEALTIIFKANDPTKAAKQISLSQLGSIKLDKDETKKMVTQFLGHQFWDLLLECYLAQAQLLPLF